MPIGNALVGGVLRSPLHRTMSRSLLLLTYRGRRTGKEYTIPVGYARYRDDELVVIAGRPGGKTWWTNMRGSLPVRVRLAGKEIQGEARLVTGDEAVPRLAAYFEQIPRAARAFGIATGPGRQGGRRTPARRGRRGPGGGHPPEALRAGRAAGARAPAPPLGSIRGGRGRRRDVSGWRAGLVAAAVGGLILIAGIIVHAVGGDDGASGTTTTAAPGEVTLACVPALEEVCADLGATLGVATRTFQPGTDLGDGEVVLAPTGDLPDALTAVVVARSPVAIAVWRERAVILAPACGGTITPACLEGAYGKQWGDLGGDAAWAAFKVGLADPTRSASALEAWRLVVDAGGVPAGLDDSLRVRATDDAALMLEVAQFGPSRADAVITTEVAIAGQLENVWDVGRLEVYYPDPGPWVDYVAVARGGDAERLVERLLSAEIQARLPALGLRPASGDAAGLPEGLGDSGAALRPAGRGRARRAPGGVAGPVSEEGTSWIAGN